MLGVRISGQVSDPQTPAARGRTYVSTTYVRGWRHTIGVPGFRTRGLACETCAVSKPPSTRASQFWTSFYIRSSQKAARR